MLGGLKGLNIVNNDSDWRKSSNSLMIELYVAVRLMLCCRIHKAAYTQKMVRRLKPIAYRVVISVWNIYINQSIKTNLYSALRRRRIRGAYMLRPCVHPSVCHKPVLYWKRLNVALQTVPHSTSGTLVFWCQRCWWNLNGVTPSGGAKYRLQVG